MRNGYVQEIDTPEGTIELADYAVALQECKELGIMLSAMENMFQNMGLPLQDLGQTINIVADKADNKILDNTHNGNMKKPLDRLCRLANIDIIVELDWSIQERGPLKSMKYQISCIDVFSKSVFCRVDDSTPSSMRDPHENFAPESSSFELSTSFEKLIVNMLDKGREISFEVVISDNMENIDLTTMYGEQPLSSIIDCWLEKNTPNGQFNKNEKTERRRIYENVFIPMHTGDKKLNNAHIFIEGLMNHLQDKQYNIPCKTIDWEPGYSILIIGEKQ